MYDEDMYDDDEANRAPPPHASVRRPPIPERYCTACGTPRGAYADRAPREPTTLERLQAHGLLPLADRHGPLVRADEREEQVGTPAEAHSEEPLFGIVGGIAIGLGFVAWCVASAKSSSPAPASQRPREEDWVTQLVR